MSILTVEQISKSFGACQAVNHVSFDINHGDIVGFLGKNGAGKTTLMRIVTSFLTASAGRVFIDGDDITKHSLTIRKKIGYLPETPPLYTNMTVFQYLKFAAEIKEVSSKRLNLQIAKVLEECNLTHVKQKIITTLSKGYKQRVGIAQAIVHEPKLLILDEPTSGLDPMQIQQVLALINDQREQRTVLLSTHTLTEIEKIAQRILIIKSGQLIVNKPLKTLLNDNVEKGIINTNNKSITEALNPPPLPLSLEQVFINAHQAQLPAQNSRAEV